eukprot:g23107.t1
MVITDMRRASMHMEEKVLKLTERFKLALLSRRHSASCGLQGKYHLEDSGAAVCVAGPIGASAGPTLWGAASCWRGALGGSSSTWRSAEIGGIHVLMFTTVACRSTAAAKALEKIKAVLRSLAPFPKQIIQAGEESMTRVQKGLREKLHIMAAAKGALEHLSSLPDANVAPSEGPEILGVLSQAVTGDMKHALPECFREDVSLVDASLIAQKGKKTGIHHQERWKALAAGARRRIESGTPLPDSRSDPRSNS